MAEDLTIISGSKSDQYEQLIPQIQGLLSGETDLIANLGNFISALHHQFNHLWTGIYIVKDNELVLGPFQGPIACTRIQIGKGVCGTSWQQKKTITVSDVDSFPGHIACSSLSRSEIVVPIMKNNKVLAVLDIDSDKLNNYDDVDEKYLNELCSWLADQF